MELPINVFGTLISFLPTNIAVRTTLCSKRLYIGNVLEHINALESSPPEQHDPESRSVDQVDTAAWKRICTNILCQRKSIHKESGPQGQQGASSGLRRASPVFGAPNFDELGPVELCGAAFALASSTGPGGAASDSTRVGLLKTRFEHFFGTESCVASTIPNVALFRGLLGLCALLQWTEPASESESESEFAWLQRLLSINLDKNNVSPVAEEILQHLGPVWIKWAPRQFKPRQWILTRVLVELYPKFFHRYDATHSNLALCIVSHREFNNPEWLLAYIPTVLLSSASNPNLIQEASEFLQVAHSRVYQTDSELLLLDQNNAWSARLFNFADELAIQTSYLLFGIFTCSYKLITSELIGACFERWRNFDRVEIMIREYRDAFGFGDCSAVQSVEKMNAQFADAIWKFMFSRCTDDDDDNDAALRLAMTAAMPRGLHRELLMSLHGEALKSACESNGFSLKRVLNLQRAWKRLQLE